MSPTTKYILYIVGILASITLLIFLWWLFSSKKDPTYLESTGPSRGGILSTNPLGGNKSFLAEGQYGLYWRGNN